MDERMPLRVGVNFGACDWGRDGATLLEVAHAADRLGLHSVWTAEAYGYDAVTPLAWIGATTRRVRLGTAVLQVPARTPAMAGMTAATLDAMSGGRLLLGLGPSGPQVVEGWHGLPFVDPLGWTREYVEVVRRVVRGERLRFDGAHFTIPSRHEQATGLGKELRLAVDPRPPIPVYIAANGPRNLSLAGEIADGCLPALLSPYRFAEVQWPSIEAGLAKAAAPKAEGRFDVAASIPVLVGEDVDELFDRLRPGVAFQLGRMGAKGRNFYNDIACRYGYEKEATRIQDLCLEGRFADAVPEVPDALLDEIALVGPKARIRDRLEPWRQCGITTLLVTTPEPASLQTLSELLD